MMPFDNTTVIKRYEDKDYVGGPTVEAYADEHGFWLRMGGNDYYNSEDCLDVEQATQLRDLLNEWLA